MPVVEVLLHLNIFLQEIGNLDGKSISELAKQSVKEHDKTIRLLRYNNHICYVSKHSSNFQCFRCHSCDTFFKRRSILTKNRLSVVSRLNTFLEQTFIKQRKTFFASLNFLELNEQTSKQFSKYS